MQAFAKAFAMAVAEAYGSCHVRGDAYGCVDGSAKIASVATVCFEGADSALF